MAVKNWYPFSVLTGGGDGALDSVDGGALTDGDRALVITTSNVYFYILDDDSGATESSPNIIAPDTNPGDKRWLLLDVYGAFPTYAAVDTTAPTTAPTTVASRNFVMADDSDIAGTCQDSCILSGKEHTNTGSSYAGILAGWLNSISNSDQSTIIGGYSNEVISGSNHIIAGGIQNDINTGGYSAIVGGDANTIQTSSSYSGIFVGKEGTITGGVGNSICGGYLNEITNSASFNTIVNGDDNTINSGSRNIIGAGDTNLIQTSSTNAGIVSGVSNTITGGSYSIIAGGENNTISAEHGFIGAGEYNTVSEEGGVVIGGRYAKAYLPYQQAFSGGAFTALGDSQILTVHVMAATEDATPTLMRINQSSSVTLPASRNWVFKAHIVARQSTSSPGNVGDSAFWMISGGIKRDDSNNTALIGTPDGDGTPGANNRDANAAAWDVTVSANDSTESLDFTVTGEADKSIRWVARIDIVEVGFGVA